MFGKWLLSLVVPLALVGALSACNGSSGAVQPGVVNTSAAGSYRGETGRVIAIREVPVKSGNTGVSDGTLIGGGAGRRGRCRDRRRHHQLGGRRGGRRPFGRRGGRHRRHGDRPELRPAAGIEVTVQKDNGQRVTIAQRDDGDVQMGDRVAIVYDRNGVAKAVRDTGYRAGLGAHRPRAL